MTSEQWKEWLRAPLEHAAARGNTDLFTRLMDAGADGSAGWQGCSGRTLLGAAAHSGSEQMVLALLKARAKPDLNIRFGAEEQSALHVAAAQGAGWFLQRSCLLEHTLTRGMGKSAFRCTLQLKQVIISSLKGLLLNGSRSCAKSRTMLETPPHLAAREGHTLCVAKLLLGGADKESRNYCNRIPLYLQPRAPISPRSKSSWLLVPTSTFVVPAAGLCLTLLLTRRMRAL
ncbi:unnamed protein product [Pylaiella littoralis]